MLHFSRLQQAIILAICILGCLAVLPNFLAQATLDRLPAIARNKINLGLDLRGGAHLLTRMDIDELKKDWQLTIIDDVTKRMREAKIGRTGLGAQGGSVVLRLAKPEDMEAALKTVRAMIQPVGGVAFGAGNPDLDIKQTGPDSISITPTEPALVDRVGQAMGTAIEVIRRRLDPDGTKEVAVQRQGSDRILVQQPGVETEPDLQRIRDLLKAAAKMTFHLVHPTMTAEEAKQSRVPPGYKIVPSGERTSGGGDELIEDRPLVTGEQLTGSQPGTDSRTNEWVVNFSFNRTGALAFGRATQANIGRRFAVVLDNKVITAPVIRDAINTGSGQISGSFDAKSATDLATLLRSGALPARLTVEEERVVGASLGQDSIDSGKRAAIIGLIGVAAFMILAYGLFGVFAVVGAALHVILVLAIMSFLGATMTLPGIAGVVLTIGMAVDANVLIYERIREELRNGKPPLSAIDAGFSRAYATIIDSQLTTFIAGLLMFALGSGPIKGFAVTLTLGIITTVFTAFTVTRMLASWWVRSQDRRTIEAPL